MTNFIYLARASVEGARRHNVNPVEWIRLRAAELQIVRYLLVVPLSDHEEERRIALEVPPARIAQAVLDSDIDRLAALLYAHQNADSMEHANETIEFLIDIWNKGMRV